MNETAIDSLFSNNGRWQSWLEVEAALAAVQADLGLIPQDAASEIARRADLRQLDLTAMTAEMERSQAPVLALVHALANACEGDAGNFVHWGATTQNIILTGRVMQVRKVHQHLLTEIGRSLSAMARLAGDGADMLMTGRTNGQHALPITFGFKVAGWIEEFLRYESRFRSVEPRIFSLIFGGAIGAMHAFGDHGPDLVERLGRRLDLNPVMVPARSMTDHFVEYINLLVLFGTSCSKIARENYSLMSQEIAELHEIQGPEVIGSSTMPQKINPKLSVKIIGMGSELRGALLPALDAAEPGHEGDASSNQALYAVIDKACPLACRTASALTRLLESIKPDAQRMRENLDLTAGAISAENVMMRFAETIGRQQAHELVHQALMLARQQRLPVIDSLLSIERIRNTMSRSQLAVLLDPANYTGQSQAIAQRAAQAAHAAAERLAPVNA